MIVVIGVIAAIFLAALVIGGVSGRVRLTSCCAVPDPRRDARMRAAFDDHPGNI